MEIRYYHGDQAEGLLKGNWDRPGIQQDVSVAVVLLILLIVPC